MANPSGESSDYKLTDLDYLIGDHHLQMIKAALPFLEVPEQKAVSVFVKNTLELFETEEIASMGICSLEEPQSRGSVKELLKAIRPYGTPQEQDLMDLAKAFIEGQTPMEQLRRLLSPEQQARFETLQMMVTAFQAMA